MRVYSLLAIALSTLSAFAQSTGPAFEVISVKPSGAGPHPNGIGLFTYPGGRILASLCPLQYLIEEAFRLQPFQISGGPRWIQEDRFDVEAKPPASSKSSQSNPRSPKLPPNEEQRQMLQALLIDRFQLHVHREIREGPVYFLVKTNKELKLQATTDKDQYPWVGSVAGGGISGDGIAGTNATMALMAERLGPYLGRPVIDQTALDGPFDFKFASHSDDPHPEIISAILSSVQALGLKLETGKGPIETLVIERVEKPAAN